jgi:peptidoglycan hydrolase CwlO-like protein
MDWQVFMGLLFLCVITLTMWYASQGAFSKTIRRRNEKTPVTDPNVICKSYIDEIERLKGKIFEQSLELDAKNAKIAEMERQLQELMNAINELTTKLQNAEAENAQLRQLLKNALEDLDKTSRQLQECTAKLLARRLVQEKCHMTPETANLIR